MEGWVWMSLSIAVMNLRVYASSGFFVSAIVSLGVSSSMGSMCMDSCGADGCVDWCADDLGVGGPGKLLQRSIHPKSPKSP